MKKATCSICAAIVMAMMSVFTVSADVTVWVRAAQAPHVYAWDNSDNPLNGAWSSTVPLATNDDDAGDGPKWWLCNLRNVSEANLVIHNGVRADGGNSGNQSRDIQGVTGTRYYDYDGGAQLTDVTDNAAYTLPTGVVVNDQNFPSPVFRAALRQHTHGSWGYDCDLNKYAQDDLLTDTELRKIEKMQIHGQVNGQDAGEIITDLTGIKLFKYTKMFSCYSMYNVTAIDLSGHTAVEIVSFSGMYSSLDVSGCTAIKKLECSNEYLTSLNVAGCTSLQCLKCAGTKLTALDVSQCPSLIELDCSRITTLTSLDVSNNHSLYYLDCNSCKLETLKLPTVSTLRYLACGDQDLRIADIENLDIQDKMTRLHMSYTKLGTLVVPEMPQLLMLYVSKAELTELDLKGCPNLKSLSCGNNALTELDLSVVPDLEGLSCNNNKLRELDLSHNTELRAFSCNNNELVALDLTGLTKLDDQNGSYQHTRTYPEGYITSMSDTDWHAVYVSGVGSNSMYYPNQQRAVGAEWGRIDYTDGTPSKKFFYFRLKDDEVMGREISLGERLAQGGNRTFYYDNLNDWLDGGKLLTGGARPNKVAGYDDINSGSIVGTILVLTPNELTATHAKGTVTYTYDVNKKSDAATDLQSPFKLNWEADFSDGVVTGIIDVASPNGQPKQIKFYNLAGQSSDEPFEGVNIVVAIDADGNQTTTKVVR